MTKKSRTKFGLSLLALVVVSAPSAGCSSSKFSMPKMSMFSWNRKPDATTLAGSTQPAGLPVSPAAKYDPSALASNSSKSSMGAAGSAYGFGATGGALAGQTSPPGQPGLAAASNGYQTGPYQLAPKSGVAPTASVASTATAGMVPGGGLPSPYGGTYSGATAGMNSVSSTKSDMPLPNSAMAAMNTGSSASATGFGGAGLPALPTATAGSSSASTPALPVGYSSSPGGPTSATTSAYQMPSPSTYTSGNSALPGLPGAQVGGPVGMPASTAYPSGLPAYPSSALGNPATPALPSAALPASSLPTANTSTTMPPSSAYQGATTLGTFSPGSTGRSTNYDFSGGAGATTSGSSGSLPTSSSSSGSSSLLR